MCMLIVIYTSGTVKPFTVANNPKNKKPINLPLLCRLCIKVALIINAVCFADFKNT